MLRTSDVTSLLVIGQVTHLIFSLFTAYQGQPGYIKRHQRISPGLFGHNNLTEMGVKQEVKLLSGSTLQESKMHQQIM